MYIPNHFMEENTEKLSGKLKASQNQSEANRTGVKIGLPAKAIAVQSPCLSL